MYMQRKFQVQISYLMSITIGFAVGNLEDIRSWTLLLLHSPITWTMYWKCSKTSEAPQLALSQTAGGVELHKAYIQYYKSLFICLVFRCPVLQLLIVTTSKEAIRARADNPRYLWLIKYIPSELAFQTSNILDSRSLSSASQCHP